MTEHYTIINGNVHVPIEKYREMIDDLRMYNCLLNAGVDNWDGYEYAQDEYRELYPEEDNE